MGSCELCGKSSVSTIKIDLAGSVMQACGSCQRMGKPVKGGSSNFSSETSSHTFRRKTKEIQNLAVVSNYSSILNSTLAKKGLNIQQLARAKNIKENNLNKYFSGKIQPDVDVARKLEDLLGIKILEEVEDVNPEDYMSEDEDDSSSSGQSLGDLLMKKLGK